MPFLNKLADDASGASAQVKGDLSAIKAKKENVDSYMKATGGDGSTPNDPLPKATPAQMNVDKVNKNGAKFGSRPGEKRINVDQFTKPLGSFKHGTDYVPKTGNYKLHEGEAVTPKEDNPMSDMFAKVPGRTESKSPKKEIKHIITKKTHDGKYHHTHVHHNAAHEDETHISNDVAAMQQHMAAAAGGPPEGGAADAAADAGAGAPAQMTASPSPAGAPAMPGV